MQFCRGDTTARSRARISMWFHSVRFPTTEVTSLSDFIVELVFDTYQDGQKLSSLFFSSLIFFFSVLFFFIRFCLSKNFFFLFRKRSPISYQSFPSTFSFTSVAADSSQLSNSFLVYSFSFVPSVVPNLNMCGNVSKSVISTESSTGVSSSTVNCFNQSSQGSLSSKSNFVWDSHVSKSFSPAILTPADAKPNTAPPNGPAPRMLATPKPCPIKLIVNFVAPCRNWSVQFVLFARAHINWICS
mmetsp:Transcript_54172/g.163994  ORF Transcript_54172/g.163994 Transcript_54172/m.163994 type:complete len:243 (-) Transcript_54172:545-1273(-)